MKSMPSYILFLCSLVWGLLCLNSAFAQVRKPVWAGRFYPAGAETLTAHLVQLTQQARRTEPQLPTSGTLKALILPHAGYVYSGLTAAHAVHVLENCHVDKVILMGPDHNVGFRNGAVSPAGAWETPLGEVRLHAQSQALRQGGKLFQSIPASDAAEHSLEVILPFLQHYLQTFELIPVVLGPCAPHAIGDALADLMDPGTLLVVSADLSHFLPYDDAVARDQNTIQAILNLDSDTLLNQSNRSCGRYPIAVLLHLARKCHWKAVLLHYANSGDTAGDHSKVVGYAAIAFYGEGPMSSSNTSPPTLTPAQGEILVALARQTLQGHFDPALAKDSPEQLASQLNDPALQAQYGTFVTLKIGKHLRGCIGSLVGNEPLAEGVRTNALNAAFHDPRFSPLTAQELERVNIEVSVLTEPRSLSYADARDLVAKLRPHVDGVTIRKGLSSATFLPQVWEQLPKPEEFLSHLCMKAGLDADLWRKGNLEVETYQVQYFEEPH